LWTERLILNQFELKVLGNYENVTKLKATGWNHIPSWREKSNCTKPEQLRENGIAHANENWLQT
jgi:hypothetical protein